MPLHQLPLSELHVGHRHSLNVPNSLLGLNEMFHDFPHSPHVNPVINGLVLEGAGMEFPQSHL